MAHVNRVSTAAFVGLSLVAALTVVVGVSTVLLSGQAAQPAHDEGTAAHIFQLSVVGAAFSGLIFLMTANWQDPRRAGRPLIVAAILVAVAFSVLFYFEHVLGY